ncbi:MAG: hypothetical protein HUU56_17150 [Bdellovibrionaceae bacterium]|nr:hypothetical protein [Pseudobdellovibrionaceae bacterium]
MGKKTLKNDWYSKIETASKQWVKWKRKIAYKGNKLVVSIPVDDYWHFLENGFALRFFDTRGGYWDVSLETPLNKIKKKNIIKYIKRCEKFLDLEECCACNNKAFLRFSAYGDKVCSKCSIKSHKKLNQEIKIIEKQRESLRFKKYKLKGKNYVLKAWIHPKKSGDDFLIEKAFKVKPTQTQIKALMKKEKSSVENDWTIIKI